MFLVAGNVVVKRLPNKTISKLPVNTYDQHNYINLFKVAKDLNQPHFERINELFAWLDNGKTGPCELSSELTEMVILTKKAPPQDATPDQMKNHIKKNWLSAYNSYYDMSFLPTDVGLED